MAEHGVRMAANGAMKACGGALSRRHLRAGIFAEHGVSTLPLSSQGRGAAVAKIALAWRG